MKPRESLPCHLDSARVCPPLHAAGHSGQVSGQTSTVGPEQENCHAYPFTHAHRYFALPGRTSDPLLRPWIRRGSGSVAHPTGPPTAGSPSRRYRALPRFRQGHGRGLGPMGGRADPVHGIARWRHGLSLRQDGSLWRPRPRAATSLDLRTTEGRLEAAGGGGIHLPGRGRPQCSEHTAAAADVRSVLPLCRRALRRVGIACLGVAP